MTLLLLAVPCAVAAVDRDVVIPFIPPNDAPVEGYELHVVDDVSGGEVLYALGPIPLDADGVARVMVVVDAQRSYIATMTALNSAGTSEPSNAIRIEASGCDPSFCDDDNACTVDGCGDSVCESTPVPDGTECDDGFIDTVDDQCVMGACEGVTLACHGDSDCDDGNVCNGYERCEGRTACLAGEPLQCDAPTQCTAPGCDPVSGCFAAPRPDETPCDDGLAETVADVCISGTCLGSIPTPIALTGVEPAAVSSGRQALDLWGEGMEPGTTVEFVGGQKRAVRVISSQLVDSGRLRLRVSVKRSKRRQVLDVVVRRPDGLEARLPGGLTIQP